MRRVLLAVCLIVGYSVIGANQPGPYPLNGGPRIFHRA